MQEIGGGGRACGWMVSREDEVVFRVKCLELGRAEPLVNYIARDEAGSTWSSRWQETCVLWNARSSSLPSPVWCVAQVIDPVLSRVGNTTEARNRVLGILDESVQEMERIDITLSRLERQWVRDMRSILIEAGFFGASDPKQGE
uniref:Uncharacterized protein n=1 Tax=Compsopogon caeruleus TaxID=31354 RepID=A0A7S1TDP4_9RHOD|mmetsp:Transcript_2463/g.4264  ORF Transcript_2463/g.4264 Transcript_2463/m.4264 type:complete len:144 (+) Transcript_2463:223-654(+)